MGDGGGRLGVSWGTVGAQFWESRETAGGRLGFCLVISWVTVRGSVMGQLGDIWGTVGRQLGASGETVGEQFGDSSGTVGGQWGDSWGSVGVSRGDSGGTVGGQ